MADESQPGPTIATMTPEQRTTLARELGVDGYNRRLANELGAARAATPPPTAAASPRAAMASYRATEGLLESDLVDLAALSDADRQAWINRHGVKRYDALLRTQLRGRNTFGGRR